MKPIHASIKVTRKELDATNGYTVGECYTPFVDKLVEQVKKKLVEKHILGICMIGI